MTQSIFSRSSLAYVKGLYNNVPLYQLAPVSVKYVVFWFILLILFIDLEKSFSYTSQSKTVLLGKNVQIHCISPRSQPYARIYWQFNDLYLHGNTNDSYFDNSTLLSSLHIKDFSLYDIGSYRCVAYNNVSKEKVFSSTMNLTAMGICFMGFCFYK